jgi:hypothetical protein
MFKLRPTSCMQVVANGELDPSIRQAASVSFKNHVKFHWVGTSEAMLGCKKTFS